MTTMTPTSPKINDKKAVVQQYIGVLPKADYFDIVLQTLSKSGGGLFTGIKIAPIFLIPWKIQVLHQSKEMYPIQIWVT